MRKQLILLIFVLVTGSLAIALPYFLSVHNQETKSAQDKLIQEQNQNILNKEFAVKPNAVQKPEQQKKLVIHGKNKIYFEDIENLNPYFKADQVEEIKQRVQSYVHQYISNDIIDCVLKPETIKQDDNIISFELAMENVKQFEVQVTKDKDNKIIDITMLDSL